MNAGQKPNGEPFAKFAESIEVKFRDIWTDNADFISIMYTGTPALKTDFTRTGKRTKPGEMQDGKHSLIRYYINNFTDGYNHDCLDLATKKLIPSTSAFLSRSPITPMKKAFILIAVMLVTTNWVLKTLLAPQLIEEGYTVPIERQGGDTNIFSD